MVTVTRSGKKKGPKPLSEGGSRHAGMFAAGPDSRRYKHDEERRKARMTVEQLAKEYTEDAFNKLAELLNSDSPKMVLEAAIQILDRGHGKAVDRVAVMTMDNTAGSTNTLSRDELENRIQHLFSNEIEGEVVEEVTEES